MNRAWTLLVLGFAACSAFGGDGGLGPIRVATLNTVLTEIATKVGGDDVSVTGILRPGIDPHSFNPSPADMRAIVDADLVLASGLGIDAYLGRLVSHSGAKGRVVSVGDAAPLILVVSQASGEKDPHWWHSIDDVIFATDLVRSELTRLRPGSGDQFAANARNYVWGLVDLRSWANTQMARLPAADRVLVTSHDAFGYLARELGFEVHPINGPSTESEVDGRHLSALVDLIRARKVRAIFVENSANPRLVENLLEETGAKLGGTLYADGLGPEGSDASDYAAMYRHNVSALVSALSGP